MALSATSPFRSALCMAAAVLAAGGPLAQEAPRPLPADVKRIIDQANARGVKIQGEARLFVNGRAAILDESGVRPEGVPSPVPGPAVQGPAQSTLRWRNGESLSGELVGVKDGALTWWSPWFTEPLILDMASLKDAEFVASTRQTAEPFLVKLRDGGRLFGDLESIGADQIKLKSARHGDVTLNLADVMSVQRTKGAGLLYHGPDTSQGWRVPGGSNARSEWRAHEDGTFGTLSWNRTSRLELNLPVKVDALLKLGSRDAAPEFTFTMGAGGDEQLVIENWSGTIVLLLGSRFVPLMDIGVNRSLMLRLLWDRGAGRALAYSSEGKLLGELRTAPTDKSQAVAGADTTPERGSSAQAGGPGAALSASFHGIQLRNNGLDLTLDELRVREWSGREPGAMQKGQSHVELANGAVMPGQKLQASHGTISLPSGESFPLEQLESYVTGHEQAESATPPEAIVTFDDGTRLVGRLQSVGDRMISMRVPASTEEVRTPIGGLKHLQLEVPAPPGIAPEPPFAKQDKLVLDRVTLHGTVLGSGAREPRWLPVGGREAVGVAVESHPVFSRVLPLEEVPQPLALVYFDQGDVLPAEVRSMDAGSLSVASDLSSVHELPAAKVQAVQFGGRRLELKGFTDPGWRQVRGASSAMVRDATKLSFRQAASFAHPNILQGDEAKFTLSADEGWGALRIRVFAGGGDEPEGGFSLLLNLSGNELYGGLESERGGDFATQVQIRTTPGQPVTVRLALQEKQVEMFANGVSLCKATLPGTGNGGPAGRQKMVVVGRGRDQVPPPKLLGAGLVFETASIWGNGEQPVTVRDFSVRANPMRPWMPSIDPKAKEQTLTLPRFRADNPPSHVLVALNGDVLRGRLEAATAEHLLMTSGLESLRVPRDRVAAVIRLQPPDKKAPSASEPNPAPGRAADTPAGASKPEPVPTHWILLNNGGRFGLNVARFGEDKIVGDSPLLGHCEVPWSRVNTIRYTAPEPTTAQLSYRDWKLVPAPEPVLPEEGGQASPLVGKDVKDFKVPMLAGGDFDYAKHHGKMVLLDFWATWCGPCIQSLPELINTVEALKQDKNVADKLVFVAMNQAEAGPQVQKFLELRGWKLPVGLDLLQNVGRQFQVEAIPRTVLIGPDGKVAWDNTGVRASAMQELADVVRKLAGGPEKPEAARRSVQ